MADVIGGVAVTELVNQLVSVSSKAYRCKRIAESPSTMIDGVQPTITEILHSSDVDMSSHRQVQLRMFFETLKKCKNLTEKVLKSNRWNMVRQVYYVKKMEDLEKKISSFLRGPLLIYVLADVHHLRVRLDRTDWNFGRLNEQADSNEEGMSRDALRMAEATTEMMVHGELENLGVVLDLGKRKVKDMMFKLEGEERLVGISGMVGSGKTTLAKEIMRDEEVRAHFGNRVLFVTVSQTPSFAEIRTRIWRFHTGFKAGATLPGQTRQLVILDDVWTRECLDRLTFKIPGTTTLVVSRFKLASPKATYDVESLNESDAMSLFCLSAFGQESVPSGFSKSVVMQVIEECKGLPLSLNVVGTSLKDRPEKYWEGALERLSRGEPADENHFTKLLAKMEAVIDTLDSKTRECFLDMGAFPQDKKIPIDIIINMWVEMHDLEEATAFDVLVDLSNKNLLTLLKEPGLGTLYTGYHDISVRQHHGLRGLALHLSNRGIVSTRERLLMPKRELILPREWDKYNDEPYNARIVSIDTGEMSETDWLEMKLPKAEVLILNFSSGNYVLPPFISKMRRLRTLVIINNSTSVAHPHNFSSFTNLAKVRSLWLEMVHVPELFNSMVPLTNLHKLSLILCKINDSFDQTALDMSKIFPNLSDLTIDHCDDLVELPSTICNITSLISISITNRPLFHKLPKNLSKLMTLELLRLYSCPKLESLPEEICELPSLKYLDISQCTSLCFLPEELGKLSTLEKIDMRKCPLVCIPISAVSLTSLSHVGCEKESSWMWEEVQKTITGLIVES